VLWPSNKLKTDVRTTDDHLMEVSNNNEEELISFSRVREL
jgi:hypothetical protein